MRAGKGRSKGSQANGSALDAALVLAAFAAVDVGASGDDGGGSPEAEGNGGHGAIGAAGGADVAQAEGQLGQEDGIGNEAGKEEDGVEGLDDGKGEVRRGARKTPGRELEVDG